MKTSRTSAYQEMMINSKFLEVPVAATSGS